MINAQPCHAEDDKFELPAPADGVVQFAEGDGAIIVGPDGSEQHVEKPLPPDPQMAAQLRHLLGAACIICGQPRDGDRLCCGDHACLVAVLAMPTEELSAIRKREALEAWRQSSGDSSGVYIHMMPRE